MRHGVGESLQLLVPSPDGLLGRLTHANLHREFLRVLPQIGIEAFHVSLGPGAAANLALDPKGGEAEDGEGEGAEATHRDDGGPGAFP